MNRATSQDKKDTAKEKFVEIFGKLSWAQIAAISNEFAEISSKYTLHGAIENAFGSGKTAEAMQTMVEFATQPYDYWAKRVSIHAWF